jgi:hypothetical protein
VEFFWLSMVRLERYRYRSTRILLPWIEPAEFGAVGFVTRVPTATTSASSQRCGLLTVGA